MINFEIFKSKIIYEYCKVTSKLQSRKTYPESLSSDLESIFGRTRPLRVAIIDDENFPWVDALENMGCKVTYFQDYTKPITQANQKIKPRDMASQDIIICDIHGVGSALYPGMDGLGVLQDLRQKHPLHVIAAYTGNPGAIYTKLKRQDLLDMVFSRDWSIDDFLLNFKELTKIFRAPQQRWCFIRKRLSYLDVSEQKIDLIRQSFVEKVLLGQMLRQGYDCSVEEARALILKSTVPSVDLAELWSVGVNVAKIAGLLSPFLKED